MSLAPPPSYFRPFLLRQLGKAVNLQADTFADGHQVSLATIRDAGFDPDNLRQYGKAEDGWQLDGRDHPDGLLRRIWYIFREMHYRQEQPLVMHGGRGLWGLTKKGVAKAKYLCSAPPEPNALKDHLIKVMGAATAAKAGVLVDFQQVTLDVIREAGFDPDHLTKHGPRENGWRLHGDLAPKGMLRRVYEARQLVRSLVMWGPQGNKWYLTEAGVAEVGRLAELAKLPNATARFLDKRLRETGGINGSLWKQLRETLSRKLPTSAKRGKIDDHIQSYFMKLIANDAFRKRMEAGYEIKDRQIVCFAVRKGYTEIRDNGGEPVEREMSGARTESERAKGATLMTANDERVVWDPDAHNEILDIEDMSSSLSAGYTEDRMNFEDIWEKVESVILSHKVKSGSGPRYARFLKHVVVERRTVPEIAALENVSKYRAAAILNNATQVLRDAVQSGELEFS